MPINGALEVSERAEISSAPVLFIHLILVDFTVSGSPMEFVHTFLKSFYTGGGLAYLDVVYDIGTDEKLDPYRNQVRKMIRGLKNSFAWERVVIGVSTHTDEDFGDPFIGYEDTKEYHSTGVNDVSLFLSKLANSDIYCSSWKLFSNPGKVSSTAPRSLISGCYVVGPLSTTRTHSMACKRLLSGKFFFPPLFDISNFPTATSSPVPSHSVLLVFNRLSPRTCSFLSQSGFSLDVAPFVWHLRICSRRPVTLVVTLTYFS